VTNQAINHATYIL